MSKKISISFSLLLTLSVSSLTFATDDSLKESTSRVQAKVKAMEGSIPVTPPQSRLHSISDPDKPKRKSSFSLSLFSKGKESENGGTSASSSSSPRAKSPSKPGDTLPQASSSSHLRGFSYTSTTPSSPRITGSSMASSRSAEPLKTENASSSSTPSEVKLESPKRAKSKSFTFSKKDIVLSKPVVTTAFVTIKDPEAEGEELLKSALSLCSSTLEPLTLDEKDTNERFELVVKPMLENLKTSISDISTKMDATKSTSDKTMKSKILGDPVSFFCLTVKRAEIQLPNAVQWAMGKPLQNSDLEKYFTTMLEDAKKTQETIIVEHTKTKSTLMGLAQGLYFPLVKQQEGQKDRQLEKRDLVVNLYLRDYMTYMNGMDDQLKNAIGKVVAFNPLNSEFNLTIKSMHSNLLKILDWAIGKEDGIDSDLIEQLNKKLEELIIEKKQHETGDH